MEHMAHITLYFSLLSSAVCEISASLHPYHTLFPSFPPPPSIDSSLCRTTRHRTPSRTPRSLSLSLHSCLRFCCVVRLCRRSSTLAAASEATSCSALMSLKRAAALFSALWPFPDPSPPSYLFFNENLFSLDITCVCGSLVA